MTYKLEEGTRAFEIAIARANGDLERRAAARALADAVREAAQAAGCRTDFDHDVYTIVVPGYGRARMHVTDGSVHVAPGQSIDWKPVPLEYDPLSKTFFSTEEDASCYPTPGAPRVYREPVAIVVENLLAVIGEARQALLEAQRAR